MVRWRETASVYDEKMRVPLHRVWTAGRQLFNGTEARVQELP